MPRANNKINTPPTRKKKEGHPLAQTTRRLIEQKKKLEQELSEARFKLNTLLEAHDTIHYLIYPKQPEKNYFSPRWEKLLGFLPKQAGATLKEKRNHVLIDSLGVYEKEWERLQKNGKINIKYQYQHPRSGKIRWLQEEVVKKMDPLYDQEVWAGMITDISEPEYFKEYISESEKRFKSIAEGLPIIIWVSDENDNITYFNNKAQDYFDLKKGKPLSLSAFGEVIDPSCQKKAYNEWDRLKKRREAIHTELLVRDRAGKQRYLAIEAIPRILPGGQFIGYIAATYDLSKEFEYKNAMETAYRLLQSSEEKYRMLFENMQLGVLEVDNKENIRYANDAFLKITGYQFNDIKDKEAEKLFCGNKESKEILSQQQKIRKKGLESGYEIQLKRKNGELATVIISGAPLFDKKGKVRGSVGIHWDVTEVRTLEKRLLEENLAKEKELIEAKLQAEEEQRTQIGQDLHDGVGQVLAYLSLRLGLAKMKSSANLDELQQLEQSARSALEQVRLLSRTLAPPALRDLGLRDAVIELVDSYDIIKKPILKLHIYRQSEDYNLNMDNKIMVYRILQELLSNSFKYAKASKITIKLFFQHNTFHFEFSDDGIGFDLTTVKKGIGLESIRSRVAFYQGKMTLATKPGKGNKVSIQLPLN